jgi:hypothetical protein
MFLFKKNLIKKNPADTPWTNNSLVGVPGVPVWNGRETLLSTTSYGTLASVMNKRTFPFQYDYAIAITRYNNATLSKPVL